MTPKEKAKELVQLFYNNQCSHSIPELAYESAKQSALICIDKMLMFAYDGWEWQHIETIKSRIEFLKEVKREINKIIDIEELIDKAIKYIEDSEYWTEQERGLKNRTLKEIIKQNDMPILYYELIELKKELF